MKLGLTREELDHVMGHGCQAAGCTEKHEDMFVNSRCQLEGPCNRSSGLEVKYTIGSGVLEIKCRQCHSDILAVNVASIKEMWADGLVQ